MNIKLHGKYQLLLLLTMTLFTLSKIHYLYQNTLAPENHVLAFIRTAGAVLFIYLLFNNILFKKSMLCKLVVHEIFALILLADILYFQFFNAFPSTNELQMLHVLPEIWGSVTDLLKLEYLFLFLDLPLLLAIHYLYLRKNTPVFMSRKASAIVAAILSILLMVDWSSQNINNVFQSFNSFGLVHFHANQIGSIFSPQESSSGDKVYIKSLEDISANTVSKPKYFGAAKDRNVIVIQVEAMQQFVLGLKYNGEEVTPNLNKLIKKDSLYFKNYHQHVGKGNTSDAEFVTMHSLYANMEFSSYQKFTNTDLYGLPKILKDKGFSTMVFHGYNPEFWNRINMYPTIGFDQFISGKELKQDEKIGWGLSDKSFFKQSIEYLQGAKQPFFSFFVTLSSHHPFKIPDKYSDFELQSRDKDTKIGHYLQSMHYADAALGQFIDDLKKAGLYENTMIALYGDHQAIGVCEEYQHTMTSFVGFRYDHDEMINTPLIFHIPNSGIKETNSLVGGHTDFLPTTLNLLGINKGPIVFYGQDLSNAKKGFIACQRHVPEGSFIDDDKVYIASTDGIFEHGKAWDFKTKQPIDIEQCREGFKRAMREMSECKYLLNNNLLRDVFAGKSKVQQIESPSHLNIVKERLMRIINATFHPY